MEQAQNNEEEKRNQLEENVKLCLVSVLLVI